MHQVKVALYIIIAVAYIFHLPYIPLLYVALALCELE